MTADRKWSTRSVKSSHGGGAGRGGRGWSEGWGVEGRHPQAGLLNQLCPHAAALNKQAALVAIPRGGVGPPPPSPPLPLRYSCFSSSFSSTSSSLLPPLLRSRKCLQLLKLLEYRDLLLTGVFFSAFFSWTNFPPRQVVVAFSPAPRSPARRVGGVLTSPCRRVYLRPPGAALSRLGLAGGGGSTWRPNLSIS